MALKTLPSLQITSKVAWDYLENPRILAKHNKVTLLWVAVYKDTSGNELAKKVERKGSVTIFTGAEPGMKAHLATWCVFGRRSST